MLDRAARLTPGGLRAAIARAVIEAAPEKARERRETAARFARVERWAEDSGNAALMGRDCRPMRCWPSDQRITWWAGELHKAGLDGGMDEIRARALLDLLLGKDPARAAPAPARPGPARTRRVRRPGHADRPAGHRGRPSQSARRAGRVRPGRPLAGPRPPAPLRAAPRPHGA